MHKNLRIKFLEWPFWAYSYHQCDGNCLTCYSHQRIGAGVIVSLNETAV